MLAQTQPTFSSLGEWLAVAAVVLSIAALVKTVFVRKPPLEAEFVRREECKELHAAGAFAVSGIKKEIRELEVSMRTEIRALTKEMEQGTRDFNLINERRAGDLHQRINDLSDRVSKLEGTV